MATLPEKSGSAPLTTLVVLHVATVVVVVATAALLGFLLALLARLVLLIVASTLVLVSHGRSFLEQRCLVRRQHKSTEACS